MSSVFAANLCAFLMSLFVGIFAVGVPYLVIDWFQAKPWHLGLMSGLSAVSYVLAALLAGKIALRFSRHRIMAGASLVTAVSLALVGFAPGLGCIMAAYLLFGVGLGFFWPAIEAYLSDGVGPTELRRRIGWFNLSWSGGDTLGVFLGGTLFGLALVLSRRFDRAALQGLPCFLVAAGVLAIAVIVLVHLRNGRAPQAAQLARDEVVPRSPARGGRASLGAFWMMALLANFAAMALRGTLLYVFPDYAKSAELNYSPFAWGVLLGVTCLTRTLGFVYWQYRHAWEYRAGYFFWLQALLPLAALILAFNTSYWGFLVAFALVGVGSSKTYFASIFYSMDSAAAHAHRGGIHEAVLSSGMILPLAAGILASSRGPRSPYVFLFALLALGMIVQGVLYLRSRNAAKS